MRHTSLRSLALTVLVGTIVCMHVRAANDPAAAAQTVQQGAQEAAKGAFPARKVSDAFPLETYPRVDCSTSAQPLAMLIGCRLTGAESRWVGAEGDRLLLAVALQHPDEAAAEAQKRVTLARDLNDRIQHTGTNKAYVALIEGKQEVILVARAPSDDELKLAKDQRVELDARPVALDAFVFMVNKDHPATNLTTAQIQEIYTGKIKNWNEVGGPDQELHPYMRDRNSGSQELMDRLVMKGEKMGPTFRAVEYSMSGPFMRLAKDNQALAYTVFFYAEHMAPRENSKLIAIDGIMPTSETIRSRKYPHVADVFVVIRKDADPKGPAMRLRDWMLSPAGQGVVAESGYVPLPASAK